MRRVLLLAGFIGSLAGPASAGALSDPVAGHAGLTAFDLAKLVVTDLKTTDEGAAGSKVVPFRHIEGKDMLAEPGDPVAVPDQGGVVVMPIPGESDRIVALIDLGPSDANVEEAKLLALIALNPKPRLLDVVEVGNDRWTGLEDNPLLLAPGAPLIVVDSSHNDADVSFNDSEMIFIRGDRFQLIDSRFTYGVGLCGYQVEQTVTYALGPASRRYRSVTTAVRQETTVTDDDGCGDEAKPPKAGVKTYAGTYTWDAAHGRFVTHSAQLKTIDALNAKWLKNGG